MKTMCLISFMLLASITFSQSKSNLSIVYGFADNDYVRKTGLLGAGSHEGKGAQFFGFKYTKSISKVISIESGLEYSINKIESRPAPGIDYPIQQLRAKMISLPVYGNILFLRYFFVNGGPIIGFEFGRNNGSMPDDQSGIGYGIGLGGKINFGHISISVNPFFQRHSVIAFSNDRYKEHLLESGFKFGVGYSF